MRSLSDRTIAWKQLRRKYWWFIPAAVAIVVICSNMGFRLMQGDLTADKAQTKAALKRFLEHLQAGRFETAYAEGSFSLQTHTTPEDLQALVQRYRVLKTHTEGSGGFHWHVIRWPSTSAGCMVTLSGEDGMLSGYVTLAEEEGQWRINSFDVSIETLKAGVK